MKNTQQLANEIRLKTAEMILSAGFGHLGASLSIVETLAVLYNEKMSVFPDNPHHPDRDWFVLSKGHGGPSYYAVLAIKGFFPEDVLLTLNKNGTNLPSHPDRLRIRGVDATTGSLGQGISQAVGIAKGLKIQENKQTVYCIVGDGECNEGQVYEAMLFAVRQKLDNFVLFIDNNKKQLDGYTKDISLDYDFEDFLKTLGFASLTVDGSSVEAISHGIQELSDIKGKPKGIVLDTTKCQGIPYFEEMLDNHHIRFSGEDLRELERAIAKMKEDL